MFDVQLQTCQEKNFTHRIILPFLLWYHLWAYFHTSSIAQGSFPAVQRCPRWKQKWLRVEGTCADSKGVEDKEITHIQEESFWVLRLFTYTDMSNKRSLLSNIAYLNSWHKEELLASSVISWTQLYQHKWRLIPLACCRLRKEVTVSTLTLHRVFY